MALVMLLVACGSDVGIDLPLLDDEAHSILVFRGEGSSVDVALFALDAADAPRLEADDGRRIVVSYRPETVEALRKRWRFRDGQPQVVVELTDAGSGFLVGDRVWLHGDQGGWSAVPVPGDIARLQPRFVPGAECSDRPRTLLEFPGVVEDLAVLDEGRLFLRLLELEEGGEQTRTSVVLQKSGQIGPPSWTSAEVRSAARTPDGTLWYATPTEVRAADGSSVRADTVPVSSLKVGPDGRLLALYADGRIFEHTSDGWQPKVTVAGDTALDVAIFRFRVGVTSLRPISPRLTEVVYGFRSLVRGSIKFVDNATTTAAPFEGPGFSMMNISAIAYDPGSDRHFAGTNDGVLWQEDSNHVMSVVPGYEPESAWARVESILSTEDGLLVLHHRGNVRRYPGAAECSLFRLPTLNLHGELFRWGRDLLVYVETTDGPSQFYLAENLFPVR